MTFRAFIIAIHGYLIQANRYVLPRAAAHTVRHDDFDLAVLADRVNVIVVAVARDTEALFAAAQTGVTTSYAAEEHPHKRQQRHQDDDSQHERHHDVLIRGSTRGRWNRNHQSEVKPPATRMFV